VWEERDQDLELHTGGGWGKDLELQAKGRGGNDLELQAGEGGLRA